MAKRLNVRRRYNEKFLKKLEGRELFYIYGLISAENVVGYIGTTYDPQSRRWQHFNDRERFLKGSYQRGSLLKVGWMAGFQDLPKFHIFAVCEDRRTAEYIERGLMHRFKVEGNFHPWKYKLERYAMENEEMFNDEIPY